MPDETTPAEGEPAAQREDGEAAAPDADRPVADEAPSLEEIQGWTGFRLDDMSGGSVGKVEGVYVDAVDGSAQWLLARMGRFGHHCLVPARDGVAVAGHVWVPYSRDAIRKAPRTKPGASLERDEELALLRHYDIDSPDVGRGAELARRDAGAVTAQPAGERAAGQSPS